MTRPHLTHDTSGAATITGGITGLIVAGCVIAVAFLVDPHLTWRDVILWALFLAASALTLLLMAFCLGVLWRRVRRAMRRRRRRSSAILSMRFLR